MVAKVLEVWLPLEVLLQFSLHLQEAVQRLDVILDLFLGEVGLVGLDAEVLVDAILPIAEEPPDLFGPGKLLEELLIFILVTVHGVVAHQILSKEDARVESLLDVKVFVFLLADEPVYLARELLKAWNQHGVDGVGKVDVKVLSGLLDRHDSRLSSQDLLDQSLIIVLDLSTIFWFINLLDLVVVLLHRLIGVTYSVINLTYVFHFKLLKNMFI